MIANNNANNILYFLNDVRIISQKHLPISHSYIPYDILLTIVMHTMTASPPSIKTLFASLKHSESGIRYHFDRLINMGWIELTPCEKDNRVKLCAIGKNYEDRVAQYLIEVGRLVGKLIN